MYYSINRETTVTILQELPLWYFLSWKDISMQMQIGYLDEVNVNI